MDFTEPCPNWSVIIFSSYLAVIVLSMLLTIVFCVKYVSDLMSPTRSLSNGRALHSQLSSYFEHHISERVKYFILEAISSSCSGRHFMTPLINRFLSNRSIPPILNFHYIGSVIEIPVTSFIMPAIVKEEARC